MSNGLKFYFESIGLKRKVRPVNRLDKDTSGLIIFAKNEYVQESLIRQMKTNEFKKEYIAVVSGSLENDIGIIEQPIKRKENSILERIVDEQGDYAKTVYTVLNRLEDMTAVKLKLETGRTHQIRVHMKHIGHPQIGRAHV